MSPMSPNQPYPPNQQYPVPPASPADRQASPAPSYFPPYFEPPPTPGNVQVVLPPPAPPVELYPPGAGQRAPLSQPLQPATVGQPRKLRKWPAILLFCLFAALIPETIITSSTSVAKIIAQPYNLPFIMLFYGTADLLIREAMIRRKLGLARLLLFGIAFGFMNEGVVSGTWYTVLPTGYAYFGGIDWLWALGLTIFHVVISVIMPIVFFDMLFPRFAGQPLLRRRGIVIATILFLGFTSLFVLSPLHRGDRLVVFFIAIALALIAWRLPPARPVAPVARAVPGLWRLRMLGFVALLVYFFSLYFTPLLIWAVLKRTPHGLLLTQIIGGAILLALTVYEIALAVGWSRRIGWSARQNLALISGAIAFSMLISIPFESNVLEPIATVPFFALLIWLAWRTRRAAQTAAMGAALPPSAVLP